MNRTGIEWTDFTWNPVTGCKHGCPYCYAREVANRFPAHFPKGFEPMFRPKRLDEPGRAKNGARIFVCSMADLFGAWVPDVWIEAVLEVVRANPQHTFQFLTKNPARYWDIDRPENAWYGTTVDGPDALDRIEWVRGLDRTSFVSFEPLVREVDPTLTGLDWVIVGGRSAAGGLPAVRPHPDLIETILEAAVKGHIPVFVKDNAQYTDPNGFIYPREFPGVPA